MNDDPLIAAFPLRDCSIRCGLFDRRPLFVRCYESGVVEVAYMVDSEYRLTDAVWSSDEAFPERPKC
jgi:hypothetical protein